MAANQRRGLAGVLDDHGAACRSGQGKREDQGWGKQFHVRFLWLLSVVVFVVTPRRVFRPVVLSRISAAMARNMPPAPMSRPKAKVGHFGGSGRGIQG